MSEMVERVARALATQAYGERDGANLFGDLSREAPDVAQFMDERARGFRWQARAAIAAMREPTRSMMRLPEGRDDWRAMIDEALK